MSGGDNSLAVGTGGTGDPEPSFSFPIGPPMSCPVRMLHCCAEIYNWRGEGMTGSGKQNNSDSHAPALITQQR